MDKLERIKMVKAMEFIARQVNSDEVFEIWLVNGVADGDIEYGDLNPIDDGELDCYVDDDTDFCDLMDAFLYLMRRAYKDGGLFCDNARRSAK